MNEVICALEKMDMDNQDKENLIKLLKEAANKVKSKDEEVDKATMTQ